MPAADMRVNTRVGEARFDRTKPADGCQGAFPVLLPRVSVVSVKSSGHSPRRRSRESLMLQALHMGLLHRLQHQGHLCVARHAANAENRWTNRSLQDGHEEEHIYTCPAPARARL